MTLRVPETVFWYHSFAAFYAPFQALLSILCFIFTFTPTDTNTNINTDTNTNTNIRYKAQINKHKY